MACQESLRIVLELLVESPQTIKDLPEGALQAYSTSAHACLP